MTRTRAATSVSLTIGAAVATLLVVGGILAGPTILQCSQQGGSPGACLRDRLDQSGLVAPRPPQAPPAGPSQPPAHSAGWIEANATEYEPPPPGVANLEGPPGAIGVGGSMLSRPAAEGDVAIAPGMQTIAGGGAAIGGSSAAIDVALVETPGQLGAGGGVAGAPATAEVALAPVPGEIGVGGGTSTTNASSGVAMLVAPAGSLVVTGIEGGSVTAGAPAEASSVPLPDVGGAVGSHPIAAGVTLEAALQPSPSTPELVAVDPPIPLTTPPPEAAAIEPPAPPPQVRGPDAPRKIPKFNPRYPNVLVAPPPNTGSNSSIVTLQLR